MTDSNSGGGKNTPDGKAAHEGLPQQKIEPENSPSRQSLREFIQLARQEGGAATRFNPNPNSPMPRDSSMAAVPLTIATPTTTATPATPTATSTSATPLIASLFGTTLTHTAGTTPSFTLPIPLRQPNWDRALGERMVWLVRNNLQQAKLELNPRNLGPVEVKLSVNSDQQVNVSFVANTPAAREAIEAALPRLREMLEQAGMSLGESDVSAQQQSSAEERMERSRREGGVNPLHSRTEEGEVVDLNTDQLATSERSGLDLFA